MNSPTLMPDGITPLVRAAQEYATYAHAGLFRRDGNTPYITHPARVVELLKTLPHTTDFEIAAAWLHDVLEDTGRSVYDLDNAGFPLDVITAVVELTKGVLPYDEYLGYVDRNPIARIVKIADMLANLTDSPTPKQVEKYTKGILYLSNVN